MRELHAEGKLSSCKSYSLARASPEELYLYAEDPWQTRNLFDEPEHAKALELHRRLLDSWIKTTGDPGPETAEVYQLEIEDQLKHTRSSDAKATYRKNSELYKQWAKEGI